MNKKEYSIDWILYILLFALPFLHVNIGLSVADQGYNLSNFELFPNMNRTWMIATLVANIVGKIFTLMPFGHYMLGMNIYCTLLLSLVSVTMFYVLKKEYNKYAVFIGLIISICFSWAPKVTLYQYLSYYLFCMASLLLVCGLKKEKRTMLYMAGLVLGINLFVRFPNVLQVSLIFVVIIAAILYKKRAKDWLKDILVCIAGYFTIVLPVILVIELVFGFGTYANMIDSLFAMTDTASSYTPFAMFYSMYASYIENFKWFKWFVIVAVVATLIYGFLRKKWQKIGLFVVVALAFLFIMRVYWYWGTLNVKYNEYASVYVWGVCFLSLSIIVLLYACMLSGISKTKKLYAIAGLIIIFITPLGSNNVLYSNFNNLYLLAPVVIGTLTEILFLQIKRDKDKKEQKWRLSLMPVVEICYLLVGILLLQTFMFHTFFVFGDEGITGNKKVTVDVNKRIAGILTTEANAKVYSELSQFIQDEGLQGEDCIVWAHSPMVYYAMDLECAIGHTWPMLDSYPYAEFVQDMEFLESYPMVIYEAQYYPNLLEENSELDSKTQQINKLLKEGCYVEVFRNDFFVVCVSNLAEK